MSEPDRRAPEAPFPGEGPAPESVVERTPFAPVPAEGTEGTEFGCPLCGMRFSHGGLVCASCPLNAGCEILKCPNCGYQFPRSSRLVDWARRLFGRDRREGR